MDGVDDDGMYTAYSNSDLPALGGILLNFTSIRGGGLQGYARAQLYLADENHLWFRSTCNWQGELTGIAWVQLK
jgi:hypothetical protein